jgi:hypothetical protein
MQNNALDNQPAEIVQRSAFARTSVHLVTMSRGYANPGGWIA